MKNLRLGLLVLATVSWTLVSFASDVNLSEVDSTSGTQREPAMGKGSGTEKIQTDDSLIELSDTDVMTRADRDLEIAGSK